MENKMTIAEELIAGFTELADTLEKEQPMKVVIMRGLPGSGKTTWVQANLPTALRCSADKFFEHSGVFNFDPTKLPEAHNWCLKRFLGLLNNDSPFTAVDNTNISLWEIAPYYRLAEVHGCDVEIIHCDCPPSVCLERQIHGVPALKLGQMYEAMHYQTHQIPAWWKLRFVDTYVNGPS
jgi:tRNA uridine 5-carbamoylmethylation protein Kti12